jgi:hypothetical protein
MPRAGTGNRRREEGLSLPRHCGVDQCPPRHPRTAYQPRKQTISLASPLTDSYPNSILDLTKEVRPPPTIERPEELRYPSGVAPRAADFFSLQLSPPSVLGQPRTTRGILAFFGVDPGGHVPGATPAHRRSCSRSQIQHCKVKFFAPSRWQQPYRRCQSGKAF